MKEISLHILDLAQNSIRAGAKNIVIRVLEDNAADTFMVSIADDGCGMAPEMVKAVQSPFVTTRTTRKVGLGIPLFAAGCENCEGSFRLESEPGRGTCLTGTYRRSHIDRPPLGAIADTVAMLISRCIFAMSTTEMGAHMRLIRRNCGGYWAKFRSMRLRLRHLLWNLSIAMKQN